MNVQDAYNQAVLGWARYPDMTAVLGDVRDMGLTALAESELDPHPKATEIHVDLVANAFFAGMLYGAEKALEPLAGGNLEKGDPFTPSGLGIDLSEPTVKDVPNDLPTGPWVDENGITWVPLTFEQVVAMLQVLLGGQS